MTITQLQEHLNNQKTTTEFKRLFHGRGGVYEEFKHLTIDSIDTILSIAFYAPKDDELEVINMIKNSCNHPVIIVQRRYDGALTTEVIRGEVPENTIAIENGIKFKLNLLSNQNSGYFPDMKNGRAFVREHAKDKNVLNLFSYTCGFSLAALLGGATSVVNVDMSKSALSTGKANHALNNIDTRGISFLPYNILKSFSGIRKKAPFEMIIIDPPSFQRGSFEATKDYIKIIQRLDMLSDEECLVMACLNSPELNSDFIIDLFKEHAPEFHFSHRLENLEEFVSFDEEKSLKNLIFIKN